MAIFPMPFLGVPPVQPGLESGAVQIFMMPLPAIPCHGAGFVLQDARGLGFANLFALQRKLLCQCQKQMAS